MTQLPEEPALFYQRHVFCCTHEREPGHMRGCCRSKGAGELQGYMKMQARELGLRDVRINGSGCLDRCEQGPTLVIYPEGVWYRYHNQADIDEILETHVRDGGRVARLMLSPVQQPAPKAG